MKNTAEWDGPLTLILDTESGSDYASGAHRICIDCLIPPQRENESGIIEIVPRIERGRVDKDGNPVESWSYVEAVDYLHDNWDNLPYKNLAIDTLNNFVDWTNEYMVQVIKALDAESKDPKYQDITDISEVEFSVGHSKVRVKVQEKLLELIDMVRRSGQLLLGIQMENTITIRSGKQVIPQQRMSGIPDKLTKWLTGHAETICMLQKQIDSNGNIKYVATFDGTGESIMGSRLDPLKGKAITFSKKGVRSLYSQMRDLMSAYEKPKEDIADKPMSNGPIEAVVPDYSCFRPGTMHIICGQPKSGKTTVISGWGIYNTREQEKEEQEQPVDKEKNDAKSTTTASKRRQL